MLKTKPCIVLSVNKVFLLNSLTHHLFPLASPKFQHCPVPISPPSILSNQPVSHRNLACNNLSNLFIFSHFTITAIISHVVYKETSWINSLLPVSFPTNPSNTPARITLLKHLPDNVIHWLKNWLIAYKISSKSIQHPFIFFSLCY